MKEQATLSETKTRVNINGDRPASGLSLGEDSKETRLASQG